MKLYHVTVLLEIEAKDEDEACRIAEDECSQSSFLTCETVREAKVQPDYPKE